MNLSFLAAIIFLTPLINAQKLMNIPGAELRLRPTDATILDAGARRSELPCTVTPLKPKLDMDFVFHSGFHVSIPTKELEIGPLGNELTTIFRVSQPETGTEPTHMFQRLYITPADLNEPRNIEFEGLFRLGEGKYHIDWLMRDRSENVCASSWDVEAKLSSKELPLRLWTGAGVVTPVQINVFEDEPPVARRSEILNLDIIINVGPHNFSAAALDAAELKGVVAILRQIAHDSTIGAYSLLACSIPGQKILYEPQERSRIDFPALGESLKDLKLGTVDAKDLVVKDSHAAFTADAIRRFTHSGSDALIIVGPRMAQEPTQTRQIADALKEIGHPVFYLTYDHSASPLPWRDLLGDAVKQAHGVEYGIASPRDLFGAWADVISRIQKVRAAKLTGF